MSARRKQKTIDFFRGFGARIREARLARDFTEREAADAIGITVRRLRRLESGRPFRGNHRALWIFSRLCGIDIAWLYSGTGPCPPRSRPKLTFIVGGTGGRLHRTEAVH